MDYLKAIKEFHKQAVAPYKGKPVGCRSNEIAELERQVGFSLPEAFKQFLLWMGQDHQGVFVGSQWFIDDISSNTRGVKELLDENKVGFELAEHYLAFFSHQGYMIAWFNLPKESEDPLVYFFNECEMARPRSESKFTEFLLKDMTLMASYLPGLYGKK